MIKVSVLYPQDGGSRFDHDYYRDKHMPMVADKLGAACKGYTVDKGLAGAAPGSGPAFVAGCAFFFDSVEAFQTAFAPHAAQIMGDIPNYTDRSPVIQINEVVVGGIA